MSVNPLTNTRKTRAHIFLSALLYKLFSFISSDSINWRLIGNEKKKLEYKRNMYKNRRYMSCRVQNFIVIMHLEMAERSAKEKGAKWSIENGEKQRVTL